MLRRNISPCVVAPAGGERKNGGIHTDTNSKNKNIKKEILDWIIHIAAAIIAGVLIVTFVIQRTVVFDISMQPTLVEGDNLLVEKLSHRFNLLKRGDVIVFKLPESDRMLIKRLVALEGDKVEVKDGKVYVNGQQFLTGLPEEPDTPDGLKPEYTNLTVPPGYVYVLGDNRPYSIDGTELGPISKDWIKGRAILRIFPLSRFGSVKYVE
ncbi:MAG: signal peptidase I [Acetivibrionales bacterium]|jgi:signal peptidase I